MSTYGYQDSSEVVAGSEGGNIGLNKGVISKFEFNPNAGASGAVGEGIDLTVLVGDKEYRKRFFPVSKVFAKGGGELTDTTTQDYKEEKEKAVKLFNAEVVSIVEVFVAPDAVKAALSVPISSFKDFALVLERLVKSTPDWNKIEVDVFLQFQWQPTGDNTKTFLQLPPNVKQGIYVVKALPGSFKEDKTDTHLQYVNEEGGIHPFKRGKWFIESAFAKQTNLVPVSSLPTGGATGTW